jgi:hypothetical protein
MKHLLLAIGMLTTFEAAAFAQDCDCTAYPFKPNPPCFGQCVAKLSAKPPAESGNVANIDPGVSVGIRVLSESKNKSTIDFKSMQGKPDLEKAALKALERRDQFKGAK